MTGTMTRLRAGRPSVTAEINAQMRAADYALRPERRLVNDQYARHFVENPRYAHLRRTPGIALMGLRIFDHAIGGLLAEILLRGRYFADVLGEVGGDVDQVILVGAGYDTTAQRVARPVTTSFVEVDHPATQRVKRQVLDRIGVRREDITFVPTDLESDSLVSALQSAGVPTGVAALVGWLGVSYYLSHATFGEALCGIAAVCAPGSTLILDYLDPSVVDGTTVYRGARRAARSVRRRGEPYTLGLTVDDAARTAAAVGFQIVEHLRVPDLVRRYGGETPYCCDDDYMGLLRLVRVRDSA
jgi:methyltransferase (TIGR00027 family)